MLLILNKMAFRAYAHFEINNCNINEIIQINAFHNIFNIYLNITFLHYRANLRFCRLN